MMMTRMMMMMMMMMMMDMWSMTRTTTTEKILLYLPPLWRSMLETTPVNHMPERRRLQRKGALLMIHCHHQILRWVILNLSITSTVLAM